MDVEDPVVAQEKKPNILFIMGDDIGLMQPSIYHRGWMVGETPKIAPSLPMRKLDG
jgi:arylsulfatase A-like enzyme